jgi:hypothetical protein
METKELLAELVKQIKEGKIKVNFVDWEGERYKGYILVSPERLTLTAKIDERIEE